MPLAIVSAAVTETLDRKIEDRASIERRSKSDVIRHALEVHFDCVPLSPGGNRAKKDRR